MKSNRFFQLAASFALALALTFSLVACGGDIPDGKYFKNGGEQYWEFSGSKATRYISKELIQKGTYKIDKDGLFLFIKEDGKIDKLLFAQEGKELLLGSTQYTKQ
ncbi:MAG: hypothetical protein LBC87_00225 [Fibromonadaceae bacterium]|nr:hypothetical protein [Fibromonadaceae bacterium]